MRPRGEAQGAEHHIRPQDRRRQAVDISRLPVLPHVVEHEEAALRRRDRFDVDKRIVVAQDFRRARLGPAQRRRRDVGRAFELGLRLAIGAVEQHEAPVVDVRHAPLDDDPGEIGGDGAARRQHARQRVGVFVNIGVGGLPDQGQVARLETAVDLLGRNAGRDPAQAEKIGHRRLVGRKSRREDALFGDRDMVVGVGHLDEIRQPDRIVAEIHVEAVDQPGVRPMEVDAREFDAVAPVRRGVFGEFLFQESDGFVLRALAQDIIGLTRQRGGLVGGVVQRQVEGQDDANKQQAKRRSVAPAPRAEQGGHGQGRAKQGKSQSGKGTGQTPLATATPTARA